MIYQYIYLILTISLRMNCILSLITDESIDGIMALRMNIFRTNDMGLFGWTKESSGLNELCINCMNYLSINK